MYRQVRWQTKNLPPGSGCPKLGLSSPAAAPLAGGASSRRLRRWARPARAPVATGPTFRHARVRRRCSARKTARRAPEAGELCRAGAAKPFCYDLGNGRAKRSRPSGVGQCRPTRSLLGWSGLGTPVQLPSPSIARRARWGTRPSLNPLPLYSQAVDLSPPTRALVIPTPVERCACARLRTLAPQLALCQGPLCARALYPPPRPQLTVSARGRSRRQTRAPYFYLTPAPSRCRLVVPGPLARACPLGPPPAAATVHPVTGCGGGPLVLQYLSSYLI